MGLIWEHRGDPHNPFLMLLPHCSHLRSRCPQHPHCHHPQSTPTAGGPTRGPGDGDKQGTVTP